MPGVFHPALVALASDVIAVEPTVARPIYIAPLVGAGLGAAAFALLARFVIGRKLAHRRRSGLMAAAAFLGIAAGFLGGALVGAALD